MAIFEKWKVKTQPLHDTHTNMQYEHRSSYCMNVPNKSQFEETYKIIPVFEKMKLKNLSFCISMPLWCRSAPLNSLIWQDTKGMDLTPPQCSVSSKHCILSPITELTEKNQHKGRKFSGTHLVFLLNKQKVKLNNCFILRHIWTIIPIQRISNRIHLSLYENFQKTWLEKTQTKYFDHIKYFKNSQGNPCCRCCFKNNSFKVAIYYKN